MRAIGQHRSIAFDLKLHVPLHSGGIEDLRYRFAVGRTLERRKKYGAVDGDVFGKANGMR